jgi:hypothetical protein
MPFCRNYFIFFPIKVNNTKQVIIKKIDNIEKLKLIDFYTKQYLILNGCVKCADGGILIADEQGYVGPNEFFK